MGRSMDHHNSLPLPSSNHRWILLDDYDGSVIPPLPSSPQAVAPFRPGIAVVVGVLTSVFSLTFLLLLYARHCKRTNGGGGGDHTYPGAYAGHAGGFRSGAGGERRNSGVDRSVVESLPVFRFAALRGQKEGLECAVCLSRFEPTEALRLLPKCRHGFHVECVDTWLDAHSTCPLCRSRVDPEDVLLLPDPAKPSSVTAAGVPESDRKESPLQIQPSGRRLSGRHSTGSFLPAIPGSCSVAAAPNTRRSVADLGTFGGVGCFELGSSRVRKDRVLLTEPAAAMAEPDKEAFHRRFGHQIVVGDGGGAPDSGTGRGERWSDLRPSDLIFLRAEASQLPASGRFSCSAAVTSSGNVGRNMFGGRSFSELAGVSRLVPPLAGGGSLGNGAAVTEEEPARSSRGWLGFASRWLQRGGPPPGVNGPSS